MRIYTRSGDKGETSLYDGKRIKKDDIRVECYGTIDELNAFLGHAKNYIEDAEIREIIFRIQRELFNVAGELATYNGKDFPERIGSGHIEALEKTIDVYTAKIEDIGKFIIPGTNKASSSLHIARTVCRRAERRILTLCETEDISQELLKYINRLSDTIYMIARYLESDLKYVEFEKL